ncbi:ankyrin repeat-containing domain protein [Tuber brumale]|nr:ankyrin repeat-containing domain protein [Tuber brumale]
MQWEGERAGHARNVSGMFYTRQADSEHVGQDEVVKLLLRREDVNPNAPDFDGTPPLSYVRGVKHLLEREDINPDMRDNLCQTQLAWAAENGHDEVVKLPPKREDVDPNIPDEHGRTPLALAFGNGHHCVEKLLKAPNS